MDATTTATTTTFPSPPRPLKKLSIVTVPLADLLEALLSLGDTTSSTITTTASPAVVSLLQNCTLTLTALQGTERHPDFEPAIRAAIQRYMDGRETDKVNLTELEDLINRMRLQKLVACLRGSSSSSTNKIGGFPWAARADRLMYIQKSHWEQLQRNTRRRLDDRQKAQSVLRKASVERFLLMRNTLEAVHHQAQSILGLRDMVDERIPVLALQRLQQAVAEIQTAMARILLGGSHAASSATTATK